MHHPVPYKESLWICIRQDVEWWAENPCLYFEINPDEVHYGFFLWRARPAVMKQFRRDITAKPDEFLAMIEKVERDTGITITADTYKRPEKCDDPRLERFYGWKGQIGCTVHEPFSEEVFGPGLAVRVGDLFDKLTPLYDFFNRYKV